MKKILIVNDLKNLFTADNGFFKRSDLRFFTAATNEEVLNTHIREKLDLIVSKLNMPGMRSEELFDIILQSKGLQNVLTIMVCEDSRMGRVRCTQCPVDVLLTAPLDADLLQRKMQELIEEAPRQAYRTALQAAVNGTFDSKTIAGFTVNISLTGMLVETEEKLPEGDRISFTFALPDGTPIDVKGGRVRTFTHRSAPQVWKCGVRFTDISESAKTAIEAFVNNSNS
jgi:DNA-binding response OmpR family regulator